MRTAQMSGSFFAENQNGTIAQTKRGDVGIAPYNL